MISIEIIIIIIVIDYILLSCLFITILIEMLVMVPIVSLQLVLNCSPYESLDPPIEGFEPV